MNISLTNAQVNTSNETKTKKTKKTKKSNENTDKNVESNDSEKSLVDSDITNIVHTENEAVKVSLDTQSSITDELLPSETKSEDNESHADITSSKDEFLKIYDVIVDNLNDLSNLSLKEYDVNKDFLNQIVNRQKKIIKLSNSLTVSIMEFMLKENLSSLKTKDKKPKKVVNKENFAINKGMETFPPILKFMELESGTLVSKGQIIQAVNAFVKTEKTANNPNIFVEGDNRSFKLLGKLGELFVFIRSEMIKRGDIQESDEFPKQISYTQIMKYLKYCFPPVVKK